METNLEKDLKKLKKRFFILALLGQDENNDDAVKTLEQADLDCKVLDASARAYGDMRRTIRYLFNSSYLEKHDKDEEVKIFLRKKACLKADVTILLNNFLKQTDEVNFNRLHKELCEEIIKKSTGLIKDTEIETFSYGQAQKWVNMFMKYMFLFDNRKCLSLESVLHVPIDSYIIAQAKAILGIPKPEKVWSKFEKQDYIDYRKKIFDSVKTKYPQDAPIIWEMNYWGKTK